MISFGMSTSAGGSGDIAGMATPGCFVSGGRLPARLAQEDGAAGAELVGEAAGAGVVIAVGTVVVAVAIVAVFALVDGGGLGAAEVRSSSSRLVSVGPTLF